MTESEAHPVARSGAHWFHWVLLGILVLSGSSMRWYRISRESLAFDEYRALYLATGRGEQLFQIPHSVIVESPPNLGFAGAPDWWNIWTRIGTVTHPPLYYVALRWCVNLFGSSDFATRWMSAVFGVAAAIALFDPVRRTAGPWCGLFASGIMLFSPAQIDISQIDRPYTMLVFFGVVLCSAVIGADREKIPRTRWIVIAAATALLALTHYFSAGAILAVAIYILCQFRGRARRSAIAAMFCGLLIFAILWGPIFWKTRHVFTVFKDYAVDPKSGVAQIAQTIVQIPLRLCLDPERQLPPLAAPLLAAFVFIVPIFRIKKSPEMLLWWLWMAGTIGMVAFTDWLHHSLMVGTLRYFFLASPAIYAVMAAGLPGRAGGAVASIFFFCAMVYGLGRVQEGPMLQEDWKTMSYYLDRLVKPGDVVAINGYYENEPAFDYFVICHYIGHWNNPVIFVDGPPDANLRAQIAVRPRVWMVGHSVKQDMNRLFPNWRSGFARGVGRRNVVWIVVPPAATKP